MSMRRREAGYFWSFRSPRTGCLAAVLMVLLMVGILVGLGMLAWFFGLKELL